MTEIVIKYPDGKMTLRLPRAIEMFSVADWKKLFLRIVGYPVNAEIADMLDQYLPDLVDKYDADHHIDEQTKEQVRNVYLLWKEMRCKVKN